MKNYRPVSLLPVFNKIFERLIYNAMFKHFLDSNLISSNQSGFKPITHDNLKGFDDGLEIRGLLLIYLKLSTKYGMRDISINYVVMVFVVIYCNY